MKDLRATKVFDDDTELMAIGYTSVKVIQLPLFTLSSERNYSNLVIQDNTIQLTGGLGTVYTPQNGACASLKGARKRILVAGVTEGRIVRVGASAGSSVTA